jgi:GNAT superfamily N-acetyltransferase
MQDIEIVFDPLPGEALRRFVVDQLDAHNLAATGEASYYPVGYFLKSPRGEWLGGLLGTLWGGWLHIRILWIDPVARGQGNGTRLLRAAEDYAVERGCFAAALETHSFQARPFYEKCDYQVFATLEDCPPGHAKYFMRKQLAEPPDQAVRLIKR